MGRRKITARPRMRHHKRSNQARATIAGKTYWLGRWGSPEAKLKFDRLLATVAGNAARQADPAPSAVAAAAEADAPAPVGLTVGEVCNEWLSWLQASRPGVEKTNTWGQGKAACMALMTVQDMAAANFGPKAFQAVRQVIIDTPVMYRRKDGGVTEKKRSRRYVNDLANRVCQIWRWAVAQELIPADKLAAIEAVPSLRKGESNAAETQPRRAVAPELVEQVCQLLTDEQAALVMLLRVSAMRPSEACRIRLRDIHDTNLPVWRYQPLEHKTDYRGQKRHVPLGPRAQKIIRQQADLVGNDPDALLFSPRRSIRRDRDGGDVLPIGGRGVSPRTGDQFTPPTIRRAIQRAAEKLGLPKWCTYQLRHLRLGEVADEGGIDAVVAVSGHQRPDMSRYYVGARWQHGLAPTMKSG